MPLTSWTRLEPVPRDLTLVDGLQARTADPLWLLARQAAFGEFGGDDVGSPLAARIRAHFNAFTRLSPGAAGAAGSAVDLPPNAPPLEVLIEAEPYTSPGALESAQAGLHYLRLLARAAGVGDLTTYRQGLLSTYAFPPPGSASPDPQDPRLRPYVGRVPDGAALYAAFRHAGLLPAGSLPAVPGLGGATASVVTAVARGWYRWYESLFVPPVALPSAWRPDRLEYAASLAAPGPGQETVFCTSEYSSGRLDWLDFDLQPAGTPLGASGAGQPADTAATVVALAGPVRYRGMPLPRFWSFEDAAVDFGAVSAPVEDVTTSLMIEFALRYGNDHWLAPLPLPVGAVCRLDSLVVVNTFGEVLLIRPAAVVDGALGPFRLFEHHMAGPAAGRDPVFVLFPTLDHVLSGGPLEEVHYLRDELADCVWAVERVAVAPNGLAVDRSAAELAGRTSPPLPSMTPQEYATGSPIGRVTYQVRTDVPGNWFPMLPPELGPASLLTLAAVPPLDGSPPNSAWGHILAEQAGGVPNEEVTRAGAQVVRRWRYARWIDGRQFAWIGRRAGAGRGPGASGLRFDILQPYQSPSPPPGSSVPSMQLTTRATVGQDTVLRRLTE